MAGKSLETLRLEARGYLGVDADDPAFPDVLVDAHINAWLNEFYADLPEDMLVRSQLLTVDAGLDRQYTFAEQSQPIEDFRKAIEVRASSDSGQQLREKKISELAAVPQSAYAITGPDDEPVLTTNMAVTAKAAIFLRFGVWPEQLAGKADIPDMLSSRWHHLPALGAAETLFAVGGEGSFPRELKERLDDGRAQALFHHARRSVDVMTRRTTEAR